MELISTVLGVVVAGDGWTRRARWSVPALGFGVFAVGTDEFVLAGMLPLLGDTFEIPITTAGQVVTAFALVCAVLAPVLGTLTARWPRRRILLLALGVYLAGNAATAIAPTFSSLVAAQMVAAAGAGLFVPAAAVTAAALVPAERRGRAIAVVTTGFTAATALGAPIGTVLGGALGWRATVWFLAGLSVLGMVCVLALVPRQIAAPAPERLGERLRPLRDPRALALMGTTLAGFTAVYIPYTYISAVFEPATGGDTGRLATLLFVFGVVGTLANYAGGTLADRLGGRAVASGAIALLVAALLVMPLTTGSLAAAAVMVVAYGVPAWALTTPQQHRLIALDPASASVYVSLNAAILYLAISLSGMAGAAGIGWFGADRLAPAAAVIALLALGLSELAHHLTRRTVDHPPRRAPRTMADRSAGRST
ncbi:MFS transporter [Actinomadura sp. 7K507]|uniref:MFS transporter n=1 Tax=Actinomadura sp. 7K507 TaxID=2530365 RepID=UPI001049E744|nr:MFS transporter [Actinomadura sp. 7K507]TDC74030.1 MFS transporter [Actinomadura sp. 7K507]